MIRQKNGCVLCIAVAVDFFWIAIILLLFVFFLLSSSLSAERNSFVLFLVDSILFFFICLLSFDYFEPKKYTSSENVEKILPYSKMIKSKWVCFLWIFVKLNDIFLFNQCSTEWHLIHLVARCHAIFHFPTSRFICMRHYVQIVFLFQIVQK